MRGASILELVAYSILAICALLQVPLLIALATRLDARHRPVWRAMRVWILFFAPLAWFALARKDRGMGDPILSVRALRLQVVLLVALGALAVLMSRMWWEPTGG